MQRNGQECPSYPPDFARGPGYSGLDAQRIARVVVQLDGGFEAHPRIDPAIIGDATSPRHCAPAGERVRFAPFDADGAGLLREGQRIASTGSAGDGRTAASRGLSLPAAAEVDEILGRDAEIEDGPLAALAGSLDLSALGVAAHRQIGS